MNAIELLKQDHQEASGLMDQIETADKGDRSAKDLFMRLKQALTLHTQIEEQIFYPPLKSHEETADLIAESLEEHKEVDQLLAEMETINPGNDEFMDKLVELRDSVQHHVDEEEGELFLKAQKVLGQSRLDEMGLQIEQMKSRSAAATNKRA